MTGRLLRCRPADASTRVREGPSTYAVVVTQFVTHQLTLSVGSQPAPFWFMYSPADPGCPTTPRSAPPHDESLVFRSIRRRGNVSWRVPDSD
jgi:hypothetical protein